jgi:hypothetical protein
VEDIAGKAIRVCQCSLNTPQRHEKAPLVNVGKKCARVVYIRKYKKCQLSLA